MIKLYIPVYNGEAFLKSVKVPPEFDVTVVDAASTDHSVDAAEARGWAVSKRTQKTGRVENWEYAVKHFLQSQEAWCKWLFTGDALYPHAHEIIMKAILSAPQAKMIICEYDIIDNGSKKRWKMFPDTRLLAPPQTQWLTAQLGNWFGSPIGQCFHRDAVADGFNFGPWVWAADMQFCYNIAKQWPVLYLAESVGEFRAEARKTFSTQCNALSSSVEEYLVRVQASKDYLHMTEDQNGYEALSKQIVQDTESLIVNRALNRAETSEDSKHLFNAMPIKQLCQGLGGRIMDKIRGR